MKGLSLKAFEVIERMLKNRFDAITLRFLGIVPKELKSKNIVFSTTSEESMISLFLTALGAKKPNAIEEQTLKTMMRVTNGYMDALRDRTSAKIMHEIDSHVTNQSLQKQPVSVPKIDKIIDGEMGKASHNLKMILSAESNKAINTGTALQIAKIADSKGEEDPTVLFRVIKDDVTGPEEWILHLLPDRKTPRVWKLSEIGAEYHKVGDSNPKLPGLHPNCRCKLTYQPEGWGFDEGGHPKFISLDHDEFKHQREKYGKPR